MDPLMALVEHFAPIVTAALRAPVFDDRERDISQVQGNFLPISVSPTEISQAKTSPTESIVSSSKDLLPALVPSIDIHIFTATLIAENLALKKDAQALKKDAQAMKKKNQAMKKKMEAMELQITALKSTVCTLNARVSAYEDISRFLPQAVRVLSLASRCSQVGRYFRKHY